MTENKVVRSYVMLACQSCHACSTAYVPKEEAVATLDRVVRLATSKLSELEDLTKELKDCVRTAKLLQDDAVSVQQEPPRTGLDMPVVPVRADDPIGDAQREAAPTDVEQHDEE